MHEKLKQKLLLKLAKSSIKHKKFIPGEAYIPVTGKVFDENELVNGMEAVLDGWWTEGRFVEGFEKKFRDICGCKYVTLVNSGSSANLVALSSLTSSVFGKMALKPKDEVITVAAGFPTTVNPIVQNQLTPVFVDIDLRTKNVSVNNLAHAITKKTKAIMLAHSLGNPMPLNEIMGIVKKYKLWFIEDCCDALGALYDGKPVGTFGHVATYSFYPAHQVTMGEGGAVVTNVPLIYKANRQFRDWGRDCWCDTGKDNTCGKRFGWKLGNLPQGYDHKYIYSQIGYNLKLTDMQAAIGLAQLEKLPIFIKLRKQNFEHLTRIFEKYDKYFQITFPEINASPSWFGFMLVIKEGAPFNKLEIVEYLEAAKIGTRSLFAGNLLKHPAYLYRKDVKVIGSLSNTDVVMERGFWIGVFPGITKAMLDHIEKTMTKFMKQYH